MEHNGGQLASWGDQPTGFIVLDAPRLGQTGVPGVIQALKDKYGSRLEYKEVDPVVIGWTYS